MPSSPEPAVADWMLPDLRAGSTAQSGAQSVRPAPAPFEITAGGGLPDALLAPARREAQAIGYAAGWASGIRAARAVTEAETAAARCARERDAELYRARAERAVQALGAAARELESRAVPAAEDVEALIASSALEIAEALVGQVLHDEHARSVAALRRTLALAPGDEPVEVRLNPADHAVLLTDGVDPASAGGGSRQIRLVPDDAVAPGDAHATCGATAIDARLSAGLARVRELLGAQP